VPSRCARVWGWALLGVLMIGLAAGKTAEGADKVTWYERDFPPVFIVNGGDKGKGFAQRIVAYFIERLTGYRHRIVQAPVARFLAEAQDRDGRCSLGLFKGGKRDQVLVYSKPVIWTPTVRVVVRRDARNSIKPYENPSGEVDLTGLVADDDIWFGATRDRSYSPVVDRALVSATGHRTIETPTVFKMIEGNRFHYTFAYPWEAAYHFRTLKSEKKYDYLPIKNQKAFLATHIGCSKGAIGRRVIADADAIIVKAGAHPPWYDFYEEWLGPREREALRSHLTAIAAQ